MLRIKYEFYINLLNHLFSANFFELILTYNSFSNNIFLLTKFIFSYSKLENTFLIL